MTRIALMASSIRESYGIQSFTRWSFSSNFTVRADVPVKVMDTATVSIILVIGARFNPRSATAITQQSPAVF